MFQTYRGMEQLAARRAHNPKVVSSSLTPATNKKKTLKLLSFEVFNFFITQFTKQFTKQNP